MGICFVPADLENRPSALNSSFSKAKPLYQQLWLRKNTQETVEVFNTFNPGFQAAAPVSPKTHENWQAGFVGGQEAGSMLVIKTLTWLKI